MICAYGKLLADIKHLEIHYMLLPTNIPDFTESFETTVKGIVWKVSKSGALKPVVNIEMVDTGDCNMENPTGYNAVGLMITK